MAAQRSASASSSLIVAAAASVTKPLCPESAVIFRCRFGDFVPASAQARGAATDRLPGDRESLAAAARLK
jgi:hypothetical protein